MRKEIGFTLIELMVVVAIVGILMAWGIPGLQNFIKNDRLTSQINTLVGHLAYARSEAVLRSQQVGLCARSTDTACGSSWENGWILYVDVDSSSSYNASTDTILRVKQALSGTSTTLTSTIGNNFLYDNRGFAVGNTGSFSLCDDRGVDNIKSIAISNTGRVRQIRAAEGPTC